MTTDSTDLILVLGYDHYGKVEDVLQAIRTSYPTIKPLVVTNKCDTDYSKLIPQSQILQSPNVNRDHLALCHEIEDKALSISKNYRISSLLNFQDYLWPCYLDICNYFHINGGILPNIIRNTAIKANFRFLTKNEEFGIPYKLINLNIQNSITDVAQQLGKIVVVKPIAGGGSSAVSKVSSQNETELKQAIRRAHEFQKDMYGDTQCYLEEIASYAKISDYVLMEIYLSGQEYSMEGYADSGCQTLFSVGQKKLDSQEVPCFRDILYQAPPTAALRKQHDVITNVLNKLKYQEWPYHIELRENGHGECKVIEVNPRVGGGSIDLLIHTIHGTHIIRHTVSRHLELLYPDRYYVTKVIHADEVGILLKYEGLEDVRKHPACVFAKELTECGSSISQADLTREAYLIEFCVVGNTSQQANDLAQNLTKKIKAIVEPFPTS